MFISLSRATRYNVVDVRVLLVPRRNCSTAEGKIKEEVRCG
jgi:hypothetical protein